MNFAIDKGPIRPTAVYRLFDAARSLLYAGRAYDPDRRCRQHQDTKSWWPEVVRREVTWYDSQDIADGVEAIVVVTEGPRYNQIRRYDAGIWDQSPFQVDRFMVPAGGWILFSARNAAPVPPHAAAAIGVEPGALAVHDWRVYGRREAPEWAVSSWDCPRPGSPRYSIGDGKRVVIIEGSRAASEQEAETFGLSAGAELHVGSYTISDQWGLVKRALVEVVQPAASRVS